MPRTPAGRFLGGCAVLLLVYLLAVPALWLDRGFSDSGPLTLHAAALGAPLPGTSPRRLAEVTAACSRTSDLSSTHSYVRTKVVGGQVRGAPYYACYGIKADGAVWGAAVLDGDLIPVKDVAVLKAGGAWPWLGVIKHVFELVLGLIGIATLAVSYFRYYRRPRPGPPARRRVLAGRPADVVLGCIPVLGWLALLVLPGRTSARRVRVLYECLFGVVTAFILGLAARLTDYPDPLSLAVVGLLAATALWGWLGGRQFLRPASWGVPDGEPARAGGEPARPRGELAVPEAPGASVYRDTGPAVVSAPVPVRPWDAPRAAGPVATTAAEPARSAGRLRVVPPGTLPTFAAVGGMTELKTLLADTLGLLLAFSDTADSYRITFNGILLHGPPGVGKTFIAKAAAGEFGLNFLPVTTSDLVSKYVGESAQNVNEAFRLAAASLPCVLFFDEFDAVARRREDDPNDENRRVVTQLLTSLEEWRGTRELVVMAATNALNDLDRAVIRPGRFDRHVLVDLPDADARTAVLRAQLQDRPTAPDVDAAAVAERTEGLTPASLAALVEEAAMGAFRESAATGRRVPITTERLLAALATRGGTDRPAARAHTWDELILDEQTKSELQLVQRLVERPELARQFGVDPPAGLLLTGPPGTGKTTIARVLAAQAHCSFYSASAAELTSKWVGESEQRIARLFERARENAPSIIFLDEIDAIAPQRGLGSGSSDRQLTQLLAEIDGLGSRPGVFVVAATNRPDVLDPALTRGGRLSRSIVVPLPDEDARRRLLALHSASMPLAGVDLSSLAVDTDGLSGGDIEAVCQQAAVFAMMMRPQEQPAVEPADFARALDLLGPRRRDRSAEPGLARHLGALRGGATT